VNGKAFVRALRDELGNPITAAREAEEARTKLMAPFTVADEAAVLEAIAGKLEGRRAELAKLEDEQNPPLLLKQVWPAFLRSPRRPDSGPETLYQYECQWSAFEEWLEGHYPEALALRQVSKQVAEEYAGHLLSRKLSANSFNKHLNLLGLVFRTLKEKARLETNPWEDITRRRLVTNSRRELTVDELKRICRSATGEMRTLLALGLYTGMRLGDCATLRWAEVDLARGVIRRVPNKSARRNPKPVLVPIHPVLRDMLAETPDEQRADHVLPETAALYLRRIDMVTDVIQRQLTRCGIATHKPGTGKSGKRAVVEVGFHSLRHSFVSLCRESNAPLAVVEAIVGHSNPAMTRHYSHVGELAACRAVAALPAVIGDQKHGSNGEEDVLPRIRRIVRGMNTANWKTKRAELDGLLQTCTALGQSRTG
jgi:integrase